MKQALLGFGLVLAVTVAAQPALASTVVVPEPSMFGLLVAAGAGLYAAKRLLSR